MPQGRQFQIPHNEKETLTSERKCVCKEMSFHTSIIAANVKEIDWKSRTVFFLSKIFHNLNSTHIHSTTWNGLKLHKFMTSV